jgi:hypothetical protein
MKTHDITAIINDYICKTQTRLAEYIVVSFSIYTEYQQLLYNKSAREASFKLDEFDHLLNNGIQDILELSSIYIKEYFSGRSRYAPRVTFKAPMEGKFIIDLYRENGGFLEKFEIKDNSAFQYIKDNGIYYICNDIPLKVQEGEYRNKRIDINTVKNSYQQSKIANIKEYFFGQLERDETWEKCWDTHTTDRPLTESCYKSTFVVPMTIVNSSVCNRFNECITGKDSDKGKMIFGFLCIDHRHKRFFNKKLDVRFGYIVADIVSLFLIVRMMYYSEFILKNAPQFSSTAS